MSIDTREPVAPSPAPERRPWVPVAIFGVVLVAVLLVATTAGSLFASGTTPTEDSVDVGFAQDMSVHHRQAVEMAARARDNSRDPAVRQLAYDIESTQNQQIGRMQGWLGLWNMPSLPVGEHMTWMSDDPSMAGHGGMAGMIRMPGMATSDDLRRLRTTPWPSLDTVFLQLMLRHHEGGVSMLVYGKEHAGNAEVRNLADQMLTAQSAESELMTRMLAERGARPLAMN